jgi:hypothetical protein
MEILLYKFIKVPELKQVELHVVNVSNAANGIKYAILLAIPPGYSIRLL